MVLSYSRRVFLRLSLNARTDSFLRGHVLAFAAFGGVPRVLLYDNFKSAVIERVDHASVQAQAQEDAPGVAQHHHEG